ncbi:MAG: ABC transporter permease [Coprobacillaceae bacterium]
MIKSIRYVLKENFNNLYRIYSISKYELVSDMRDSRLGIFWNFANPIIQIITYYFVFGLILSRGDVKMHGVVYPFIDWMLAGMVVWFFISPCITQGCNAIFSKVNVITKMKFPVSILPATVVLKELFNHMIIMGILFAFYIYRGIMPSLHWLGLLYYCFAAVIFAISLSMVTSVLNMLARDTRKLILACMRLLLYITPILWPIAKADDFGWVKIIMKINPIYYIVCGYRDCFLYHNGFSFYWKQALCFWVITAFLFMVGSWMMYKFKHKFIDLI